MGGDGLNVNMLVHVLTTSPLSRSEIQILTDCLLNKQNGPLPEHSEWSEVTSSLYNPRPKCDLRRESKSDLTLSLSYPDCLHWSYFFFFIHISFCRKIFYMLFDYHTCPYHSHYYQILRLWWWFCFVSFINFCSKNILNFNFNPDRLNMTLLWIWRVWTQSSIISYQIPMVCKLSYSFFYQIPAANILITYYFK